MSTITAKQDPAFYSRKELQTAEEQAEQRARDLKACSETKYREASYIDFLDALDAAQEIERTQFLFELRERHYHDAGQTLSGILQRYCEQVAEREYRGDDSCQ